MSLKRELNLKRHLEKIKSNFGLCVLTVALFFNAQVSFANNLALELETTLQSIITGTVTDTNGAPLPGASVVVKGTTNGTQTDFDGNYTLNDVAADAVLVFSYIGYSSQEIPINGQTTINATLLEDAQALDEVVIVGYQTQTRGDLTGSVASVDLSEANKQPLVNVAEALQGRAAGVTVVNSGTPGSAPIVRVRGFGTVNNNNPLYIIDGVQTLDSNVLNTINPDDIAQFNVLKDGAASIYGARASNGVIIITTKSGSYNQNKATLTVNSYTGFSQVDNSQLPDLLNPQQLGNVFFESFANDGSALSHPQFGDGSPTVPSQLNVGGAVIDGVPVSATVSPNGTNFLDEIFETAFTQNLSLSLSNGGESSKYAFSTSYLNRQGVQLNNRFLRGQVRLNSEFKILDKLRIGNHLNVSFDTSRQNSQVENAQRISPLVPVFDDQGRFAGTYANNLGLTQTDNPVALLERGSNNFFKTTRILGDVYASLDILEGLTAKTVFAGDINLQNSFAFIARNPENSEPANNSLNQFNQQQYNYTWTNTLNYVKTIDKHSINALFGIEAVAQEGTGFTASSNDFLFENREFLVLTNGRGGTAVTGAFEFENTLSSVFGSLNYSYDGRYLATATLRRDRSSRFIGDNQSDSFFSISGGWVISEENFFPENNVLNRLKLKASYGELGNQELPIANPTSNLFAFSEDFGNFPINGGSTLANGVIFSQSGNPNLRWETSENINVGLDFGFFDNSLTLGVEYYNNTTRDLLVATPALDTGPDVGGSFVNAGDVRNKGFDVSIGYQNEIKGGFRYGINANFSTLDNEVLSLIGGDDAFFDGIAVPFANVAATRTQAGQPISSFFGRVTDGIYRTEAEVAAGPDQGFATDAAGVGRIRYVDQNGDGVINDDDNTFIGDPLPDVTFGLNLNAEYKGWDFSAFFAGTIGNDLFNTSRIFTDLGQFPNGNRNARVLDAFNAATNPNGNQPALSFGIQNQENLPSEFFIEDGSFVKLRNLQIGYTLPDAVVDRLRISKLRFYISGTNLFTITGYSGIDPEVQPLSGSTSAFTIGVDRNTAPISQQFLLGINLNL